MVKTQQIPGLARALLQAKSLTQEEFEKLQQKLHALNPPLPFIEVLLNSGILDARALAKFCSKMFGYALLDLASFDPKHLPQGILDIKFVANHQILVLAKRGKTLFVAISDPTNIAALDEVKFQTQLTVEPVMVEYPLLLKAIEKIASNTTQLDELIDDDLGVIQATVAESEMQADIEDAPIVRFLQKILQDAISRGASDLHFEPFEKFYRIRLRIDGVLIDIVQPPLTIKEKLCSRIKVISKLDISEKRVPQDGRMRLVLSPTRVIDFRVSTLPTLFGEKIVMRILDPSQAQLGIDALGYEPEQKATLLEAIHRPYGMVLVTGPTGSGKTVSLYTCLNILNQPNINISTAEDPAEINLPGVNQVNVNDRAGLTFPVALRAFLRQDPDVIMVGEIRDLETADISIKAAQTGHMVFSTLHTNDAPSTLTRLMNMGVPAFNIASSVILIVAQRLARRLCHHCKRPTTIEEKILLDAGFPKDALTGDWMPYEPIGCETCNNTGYKGRIGIYQIMPITEKIERIILAHGTVLEIAEQAKRDGVKTLRESGLLKVKQGLTSFEEVLGCTNL